MSGDTVLARWQADRATYIRDHVLMAVLGAVGASGVLWLLGNSDYWVGAVAAPLAIALRGGYLASEDLSLDWVLTSDAIEGSNGKRLPLARIDKVRGLGSAVQLIMTGGDKHMMKYLADPAAVRSRIEAACNHSRGNT